MQGQGNMQSRAKEPKTWVSWKPVVREARINWLNFARRDYILFVWRVPQKKVIEVCGGTFLIKAGLR